MNVIINGNQSTVKDGVTVAELLNDFGLKAPVTVVEINGRIINKNEFGTLGILENDAVELIRFMGGG
jgi:thiamine biosynthesis protein ThiS